MYTDIYKYSLSLCSSLVVKNCLDNLQFKKTARNSVDWLGGEMGRIRE